jgi:type VI secretion system secreted protein VgrG
LLDKMIDATQQTPAPLAADLLKKTALVKNTEMLGLPHKLSEKTQ